MCHACSNKFELDADNVLNGNLKEIAREWDFTALTRPKYTDPKPKKTYYVSGTDSKGNPKE
jgi:hypothetical protein